MRMSEDQITWYQRACARLSADSAATLIGALVEIPSPTGGELALAEFLAENGTGTGLRAKVQHLVGDHANAVLRFGPESERPGLLLYSPIDTHLPGCRAAEVRRPGVTSELSSERRDGYLIGVGAQNPKGHAAAILLAMQAISAAGVPLAEELVGGFGGGGMPVNVAIADGIAGHGSGCSALLNHGLEPLQAIIAKPGPTVSREEVGLLWARVRVTGQSDYVGIRHRTRKPSPLLAAAQIAEELEAWFPSYTDRHTVGEVVPQGAVGALRAGDPDRLAFLPASADLDVDLRTAPGTPPEDAFAELAAFVAGLALPNGLTVETELRVAVPGGSTPADADVVLGTAAAWAAVHGREPAPSTAQSGSTDANILRGRGIATARVGTPPLTPAAPLEPGFDQAMNVVDVAAVVDLAKVLIHAAIDLCGVADSR